MTIDELREPFGLSRWAIRHYVRKGIIPPPIGKTYSARYDNRHREAIIAWKALQHNNVRSRDALALCQEEGITLYEFMRRKEASIKTFGLGVA